MNTFSRRRKLSLFVHSRIRWRDFWNLDACLCGKELKGIHHDPTSVVRKRLRIRIHQEHVFVEEVHVKLTSSPSPRRFQRDESFSGIRFYLPPHTKIPTYNSIHWEFVAHGSYFPFHCNIGSDCLEKQVFWTGNLKKV